MLHRPSRRASSSASIAVHLLLVALVLLGSLPASSLQAEGSSNMLETNTAWRAFLEWHETATSAGIPRQTTIKAFARAGEQIFVGSSAMNYGNGNVVFRAPTDPAGSSAKSCRARNGGNPQYGRINSLAEEKAGASPNPGGFVPCVISAAETSAAGDGIWEFDFISPNPKADTSENPAPIRVTADWATGRPEDTSNASWWINAWDVSVRDAASDELPGRVFANYLALNMGSNANSAYADLGFDSQFYILTNDGYGYLVDMNNIDPFGFIFFSNSEGIVDARGNPIYRSVQLTGPNPGALPPGFRVYNPRLPDDAAANAITHKIFFNLDGPDPSMPTSAPSPSGPTWLLNPPKRPDPPTSLTFTGQEGTLGQAGTNPLGGFFGFESPAVASYRIVIDLNNDNNFGNGNDRQLNGTATLGSNRVFWDGLDGLGQKVPAGVVAFNAQVQLFVGEVHFPFIDAENHPDGHRLTRVRDSGLAGAPDPNLIYFDDTYTYRTGRGYDYSLCANGDTPQPPAGSNVPNPCYGRPIGVRSALNGTSSAGGAHAWTFANTSSSGFGDRRLIDTWTYYPSAPVPLTSQLNLAEAELSVVKTHTPAVLTPGGPLNYTVTVTNNGPSTAVDARVRDDVPAQVLGVSWTCTVTGGGSCRDVAGTGNLIDTTVTLNSGATATYQISGTLSPDATGSLANTASVRRPNDTTDPNPGNNDDTNVAPIAAAADLELNKSLVLPIPTQAGPVEFSIALRNRGPNRATGVEVVDRLAAEFSFVSATPSQGSYDPVTGLWTVGALERDGVATLSLRANWNGQPTANTAEVSRSDQPDPDSTPGNNDPSEDDYGRVPLPSGVADLELAKRVNVPRVNVGATALFTIDLLNKGPDTATNVRVSDRLPVGLQLVRATPAQGSYEPVSGEWTVGTLASGAQTRLELEVRLLGVGPFTNIAQVSGVDQFDPDSTPNNDNAGEDDQGFATVAGDLADLSLTKRVSTNQPDLGEVISYTLELRNAGPSGATGVEVLDQLPAGLGFVGATPSQGSYNSATGAWTVGALAAGGTATLTVNARVQSGAVIVNTAQVSRSDQPDPDSTPGNNDPSEDDQDSIQLTPRSADLELTKRVDTAAPRLGALATFTIDLTNKGPFPTSGVRVAEQLPAGLSYVSHTTTRGSYNPATGSWEVGDLGIDELVTLSLVARMDGRGPFVNTAEVSASDLPDPDSTPGNGVPGEDDQASAQVATVVADLSVSKRASAARPASDGTATYTIEVYNSGPDPATGVSLVERLPVGSTVLAATPSKGSYNAGNWTVGALAVNERATLTLQVQLTGAGPYVNAAEVATSDQSDPDSTPGNNNPDEDDYAQVTLPAGTADLELDKAVVALPKLNRGVLFTIVLTNKGPDTATGVEVSDPLAPELRFVNAAPSQGSYEPTRGIWRVGTLLVGQSVQLLISAQVNAASDVLIVNTAQVRRSDQFDPDSTPNNNNPAEDDQDTVSFNLLTPITLTRFAATRTAEGVAVEWTTGLELNTLGFHLYRSANGGRAGAVRVTSQLIAARGGSGGASYRFVDRSAAPGASYRYWLAEVDGGGGGTEYGPALVGGQYRVNLPLLRR